MVSKQTKTTYRALKYTNDDGWWTVSKVTESDFAKVESQWEAEALIQRLEKADKN